MKTTLTKAHGNWVAGERFFNRDKEIVALRERSLEQGHTLLTAQRRMGKTSLVRELKRRLQESGEALTLFIDDVDRVYETDMLGVRGQSALDHYEERLKMVLGPETYIHALDLLTEAAVHGPPTNETLRLFAGYYAHELRETELSSLWLFSA